MPASMTITTFNSFLAGTKARASEVNENFANFRGHLLPIDPNTVAAANGAYDLGNPSYMWRNLYVQDAPYVNGSQMVPLPVGAVLPYAGLAAPSGFLLCDGSAIDRTTYAALFAAIGEYFGGGDLSTTFNIPDMRGRFMRGLDAGTARDPDYLNRISSLQAFSATGITVANTTTFSSVASSVINRLVPGMRCWGVADTTATTGRTYNSSSTIASISAAVINTLYPGVATWSTNYETSTIQSVNTGAGSYVIDNITTTLGATSSATFNFLFRHLPTTTIASINTAAGSMVFSATCTVGTTSASITFDAGTNQPGSTQLDALQDFRVGSWADVNCRKNRYYAHIGQYDSQAATAVLANAGAVQSFGDTATAELHSFNRLRPVSDSKTGTVLTSSETRGKNIYINYIVKY